MTVSQATVALSGEEKDGTSLFSYPAAMMEVRLHGGDGDVIFLDQEQGRLLAQGALEGGYAVGSIS